MAKEGFIYQDTADKNVHPLSLRPEVFHHNGIELHTQVVEKSADTDAVAAAMLVGDTQTAVSPEVTPQLSDAITRTQMLERSARGADCYSFGVLFAGGEFPSAPHAQYDRRNINYSMSFADTHAVVEEGIDERLPSMALLGMGTPDMDGRFWPDHVFVKLPTEDPTEDSHYVSKLTKGPVAITDLPGLAEFYHASHVAVIDSLSLTNRQTGEVVGKYHRE